MVNGRREERLMGKEGNWKEKEDVGKEGWEGMGWEEDPGTVFKGRRREQ